MSEMPRLGPTNTTPKCLRAGIFQPFGVVTGLGLHDTGQLYHLPATEKSFSLGSRSDCSVVIDSPYVSQVHCKLDRRTLGLLVSDQVSKNGTWYDRKRQEKPFYVRPGDTFVVGARTHRLLALNDHMRAAYPVLTDIVGQRTPNEPPGTTPADVIFDALNGTHLLITSEPECEQLELARIIHALSGVESRSVELKQVPVDRAVQLDLLGRDATRTNHGRDGTRTTLVLDLGDDNTRLPSSFVEMAFSPPHVVRVIVLASGIRVAHEALGNDRAQQLTNYYLPPVAVRRKDIARLVDRALETKKSSLRFAKMTTPNQEALLAYSWPDNFACLREVADMLSAIHETSVHSVAVARGISSTTLYRWFHEEMKLSIPLTEEAR